MAAHRYWRVRFLSPSISGAQISVSEMEMMTASGGADQCSGGSASSSSGTAANAFDNNNATNCTIDTADSVKTVGYDFGAGNDKDIIEYTLRFSAVVLVSWVLEHSDDNAAWTAIDRKAINSPGGTTNVFPVEWDDYTGTLKGVPSVAVAFAASWAGASATVKGGRTDNITIPASIVPVWEYVGSGNFPVPVNGAIAGVVTEGGVPVPYATVYCYFRPNGMLIAGARCNVDGEFIFEGLDPTTPGDADNGKYFVVALDPNGGTRYNALIYDRVVPS